MRESPPEPDDIAGRARAAVYPAYDRQLGPLGHRAMEALSVRPGDRILDLGCGAGGTCLELAQKVGPGGEVLGIDLSAAVLETACRRSLGQTSISFVQGDAQIFPFRREYFDAAFSRFGVMFFADPVTAFANILCALKPGGRLSFVCWRSLEENEVDVVPLRAAYPDMAQLRPHPSAAQPFSFARQEKIQDVLSKAGYRDIAIAGYNDAVSCGDLESTLELVLQCGSLGKIMRESPQLRPAIIEPVRKALAPHDVENKIWLNAATWIVSARKPH